MGDLSPWLVLAGLGAFHGLNPAMGWLFAVALGLNREDGRLVVLALAPIALGHALSITLVALAVVMAGLVVDYRLLQLAAGVMLIGWAVYHALYGHSRRVRIGMGTGLAGLVLWSFLMATSHGAGLMLVPVLMPLCLSGTPGQELLAAGSFSIALAAVAVHTAAMLTVTGLIAVIVYRWVGLAFLRRGWINLDVLWTAALAGAGLFVIGQAVWW